MKFLRSFHPYAMTTILFWSMAYVLTKLALLHFSAASLGFLRYVVASAVLLVIAVATKIGLPRKADIPWFIAAGISGFFLYMIAFNVGTGYVTAATSSLIIASVPVITALLASFVFREKLKAYQWAAIAVEFGGILVITVYESVFSLNAGTLWLLLAAVLLSCYNLLQRRLTKTYSAVQTATYAIFAGTVLLAVFLPGSVEELKTATVQPVVCVVLLGVFSSAVAYIAWSKALEKAERTSLVSNYMFFTPFITGVLGFLVVGEVPEPSVWVGGAFIIAGAIWFNKDNLFVHRGQAPEAAEEGTP